MIEDNRKQEPSSALMVGRRSQQGGRNFVELEAKGLVIEAASLALASRPHLGPPVSNYALAGPPLFSP